MIAQGSNKSAITQYNLVIDGKSIPCDYLCSVLKAFDSLFLSHFVFNIAYDENLIHFYEFIQLYYYKIDCEKITLTSKMIELRSRLSNYC